MPRRGLDTEQVVQAAVALADEHPGEVTLARVADALGVRTPSLYSHVGGRDELLDLIALHGLRDLTEAVAAAAAGRAGPDAVRAVGHAYRGYAHAHPGCYAATLEAPAPGSTEREAAAARLLELLGAILRGWRLEGDELVNALRVLRSALHGFVALEQAGGFALPRARDASFERLLDTVVAGLG